MQLTHHQLDALRGLVHAGIDRGVCVLNELAPTSLRIETAAIQVLNRGQLPDGFGGETDQLCEVLMPFNGTLEGEARGYFSLEEAGRLVGFFTGKRQGSIPIDTLEAGTLNELTNIVLNGVMGTISNQLELNLIYQVPGVREGDRNMVAPSCNSRPFAILQVPINFLADGLQAGGVIALYIEERSFQELIRRIEHFILEAV